MTSPDMSAVSAHGSLQSSALGPVLSSPVVASGRMLSSPVANLGGLSISPMPHVSTGASERATSIQACLSAWLHQHYPSSYMADAFISRTSSVANLTPPPPRPYTQWEAAPAGGNTAAAASASASASSLSLTRGAATQRDNSLAYAQLQAGLGTPFPVAAAAAQASAPSLSSTGGATAQPDNSLAYAPSHPEKVRRTISLDDKGRPSPPRKIRSLQKSRAEKKRRAEINDKMRELLEVLELNSEADKTTILREAIDVLKETKEKNEILQFRLEQAQAVAASQMAESNRLRLLLGQAQAAAASQMAESNRLRLLLEQAQRVGSPV